MVVYHQRAFEIPIYWGDYGCQRTREARKRAKAAVVLEYGRYGEKTVAIERGTRHRSARATTAP